MALETASSGDDSTIGSFLAASFFRIFLLDPLQGQSFSVCSLQRASLATLLALLFEVFLAFGMNIPHLY